MKKTVKFFGIMMAVIIAMTALTSCGKSDEESAKEMGVSFMNIMNAFKSGDVNMIENYTDLGDDEALISALAASLANLDWKVNDTTINSGKSATLDVDVTMLDASQIMQKYITNVSTLVSSPDYQSKLASITKEEYDELMNAQLISVLESGEIPVITENVTVEMVKQNGEWQLTDSSLPDKLIGNTLSAIKQIKQ